MRQFDKLLLAVSLVAPLLVATVALPKFAEWVTAPVPRSSPVSAGATATPVDVIVSAAATPRRATSAAPAVSPPVAQSTVPVATPEAQPARIPPEVPREAAAVPTAEVRTDDPVQAISRFYALVSSGEFGAAEELWSSRMRSRFPPQENIVHRFSSTDRIGLQRASVETQSQSQATVAADVLEIDSRGAIRHFVGRWHLVRVAQGWLLDRPELEAVP
jgi:hypothetical protein